MEQKLFIEYIKDYPGISAMVREHSYQEILESAAAMMHMDTEMLENFPMGGYSKGRLSGAYRYVLEDIIKNIYYYDWLFQKLADETSKNVFTNLMKYRIVPDIYYIEQAYDGENHQYFDKGFVHCSKNEVFVDCGGFIGDTTEDFIECYREYAKIYVYEPSGDNIISCRKNLKKYSNIKINQCGVGESSAVMELSGNSSSSSFMGTGEKGEESDREEQNSNQVEIVSLDEDIKEPVTFIKMDIEGFEIPAILGAKKHIRNDSPKLAVCTYHIISDLWEIPKLIDYIRPNYKFYLRHYMKTQNWETVIYAIPESLENITSSVVSKETTACGRSREKKYRVVAMAPYERGWSNVELIKDCGLIPYLLYKNHNCDVSMVGATGTKYPYLKKYVQGLKMELLPNGSEQEKLKYIEKNADEIDGLLLRGCYTSNFKVAKAYKERNPYGKIYVGLDANSQWMDRILWDDPDFTAFMDVCDVIATSGKAMQEHLNEKWPWKIEHITNGYYSFDVKKANGGTQDEDKDFYEDKENIILTVSRIGTEQKAVHVMLEAFALIADKVPDWRMHLVGSVEPSFHKYIEKYFESFPDLKERVHFIGTIEEREDLMDEYRKAKIFALSSICEGMPNVIAESLHFGCVIATTKVDIYEEATDSGKCGAASEIDDIAGFAKILLELCKNKDLSALSKHAQRYANEHFDMEKIVARLYEILFGGNDGKADS